MSINKFEKDMNIIKALPDEPNDVGGLSSDQLKSKFDEGGIALKNYINDEIVPALEDLTVIAEGAAHTILDKNGNAMPQRAKLKFTGDVTDDGEATVVDVTVGGIGAAPAVHQHDASAVISGVLPIERGGTGGATAEAARESLGAAPATHVADKSNPHAVTAVQVGAEPAIESTDNPGCYYRMVGNEKEWLNPPMATNAEYRTPERYLGKPVYTSYRDIGYLDKSATVAHGLSLATCISIEFFNGDGQFTFDAGVTHLMVDSTNIHFQAAWPVGSARFLLKYTKP